MCKLNILITYIIRILFIINAIINIGDKNYYFFTISIVSLLLTFISGIWEKLSKRPVNSFIKMSIIIFIFMSLYLGTLHGFYRFTWWDTFLHFISGIILSFLSLSILKVLHKNKDIFQILDNKFIFIYIISFSVFCGAIWEIYEFTIDILLNLDMQGVISSGVTDTMQDLIADFLGSLIVATYFLFKSKKFLS